MIITGIDPGGTTGLCTVADDEEMEFSWAQMEGLNDVWRYLTIMQPDIIIYERFDKTAKYADTSPIEVIGVIKLYAEQRGIQAIPQGRSVKAFWTDFKMKKLGGYCIGQPHATDAARHLLNYIVNTKKNYGLLQALRA